jgi:ATP-dependent RNA helicase RhlE
VLANKGFAANEHRAESATWLHEAKEYFLLKFEQFSLDARVLAGVKQAGFAQPTPIQARAIPVALEGRDVIGLAQTGTGKTASFLLPILERLTDGRLRQTRALIVAPTRELAEQIHESCLTLAAQTKIRSATIYGGVGKGRQIAALRSGVEIVIACPGRLLDLMNEGYVDLSHVEVLVLDEADRMCDMGFLPDIRRILQRLPSQRQTLFFSATMPADIRKLAEQILKNPVTLQVDAAAPAKTVSHAIYPVAPPHKKRLLLGMLSDTATGRVLIFTRTKHRAKNLAGDLSKRGYRVSALQGNMAQNQRQRAISGFRDGKYDILVATDIAARGIDVSEISHVINFDMPDTVDAYTHRIGRTGRAHATGEAFTFVSREDEAMVRQIENVLGKRIERRSHASTETVEGPDEYAAKRTSGSGSGSGNGSNSQGNGRNQKGRGEQSGNSAHRNSGNQSRRRRRRRDTTPA